MNLLRLALPFALLGVATPAAAQGIWEASGPPRNEQVRQGCGLRNASNEAATIEVRVWLDHRDAGLLEVTGKGWLFHPGVPVDLKIGGTSIVRPGKAAPPREPGRGGFTVALVPEELRRLFASRRFSIHAPQAGIDALRVDLPPGMLAEQDLERCLAAMRATEEGSGAPAAVAPQLRANVLTADDYPSAARRMQASGRTRFRMSVSAHGYPLACDIVESAGYALLDQITCNLMMRRARFTPATDAKGQATRGDYEGAQDWVAPPPQPRIE